MHRTKIRTKKLKSIEDDLRKVAEVDKTCVKEKVIDIIFETGSVKEVHHVSVREPLPDLANVKTTSMKILSNQSNITILQTWNRLLNF